MMESATASSASYEPSSYDTNGQMEGSEQLVEGYISSPEMTQSARRFRTVKQQPVMMFAGLGVAVVLGLLLGVGTSFLFKGKGGAAEVGKPEFKSFKLADAKCAKEEEDTVYAVQAAKVLAKFHFTGIRAGEDKKPEEGNPAAILGQIEMFIATTQDQMVSLIAEQGRPKPATPDDKASQKFDDLAAKLGEAAKLRNVGILAVAWHAKNEELIAKRNDVLTSLLPLVDDATKAKVQTIIDWGKSITVGNVPDMPKEGDATHKAILEAVKKQVDEHKDAKPEQKASVDAVTSSLELLHTESSELVAFITKMSNSFEALKKPFESK